MNTHTIFLSSLLGIGLVSISLSASAFASPRTGRVDCEQLSSYMIDNDGRCIDLTYVNGGRPQLFPMYESKIAQFETALVKIGVPVSYQECEEGNLLGFYVPAENRMTICKLTQEVSQRQIYETLVHESWHTVQDCMSGINNASTMSISQAYPEFRQQVLGGISLGDFAVMGTSYDKSQHLTESEARFMQNKPELVLEWLGRCQSY